jgi:hypothetical protein
LPIHGGYDGFDVLLYGRIRRQKAGQSGDRRNHSYSGHAAYDLLGMVPMTLFAVGFYRIPFREKAVNGGE